VDIKETFTKHYQSFYIYFGYKFSDDGALTESNRLGFVSCSINGQSFKGLVAGCHSFCLFFIFYNIHTSIQSHSHNTFIHRHSPGSLSMSSSLVAQWEKPPCGAEPRIELGPALQQADALPTVPRRIRVLHFT
jgi:hypothetical protein